jgi:protein-disulfide isomerase
MPQPSPALFRYRRAQLAALAFAILAFAVAPARAEEFTPGPLYNPSGALYNPTNQAVIGNPNGKITLVEFFDYNCGYCKRALNDLARLLKDNPDLRVVLRDLPILAPSSVEAARIANAANNQLKGAKFWEFHQKLARSRRNGRSARGRQGARRRHGQARQGRRCAFRNGRHCRIGGLR